MKFIELSQGYYQAKWSATDLYDYAEEKLREALLNNEEFETECEAHKECEGFSLVATRDVIEVTVRVYHDDYDEVVNDCVYESGVELSYKSIDMLFDEIIEVMEYPEVEICTFSVSRDTSYEKLMETIDDCLETLREDSHNHWNDLVSLTNTLIEEYKKYEETLNGGLANVKG